MPYRHAHWWILGLFPLIAIAFWPNYLGQFRASPFALHAHGMTSAAWLLLLALQSWSLHARRIAWHRTAGLATFVILPLFAAAGPLALWSMIALHLAQTDPFHAAYGARLAMADMIAGPTVIGLVVYAFVQRRRVRVHAAAMLATAIIVLPPVLGRLVQRVPLIPDGGAWGVSTTVLAFLFAWAATLAIGLVLARGRARVAFGVATLSTLAQLLGFLTVARTPGWEAFVGRLVTIPVAPVAVAAGVAALCLLWWAWRRVPARTAPAGRAGPVAA